MTDWVIPCLLAGVAAAAMGRRTDVYGALTDGAAEGLRVLGRILPALVVLLSAVQMFRASGAMELLTGLLSPVLEGLGIPPETAVLLLVRPVSRLRGAGGGQPADGAVRAGLLHWAGDGGDAGMLGDDVLHRGGLLRRCGHPPHPPHRPRGAGGGCGGLHRRRMGGAGVLSVRPALPVVGQKKGGWGLVVPSLLLYLDCFSGLICRWAVSGVELPQATQQQILVVDGLPAAQGRHETAQATGDRQCAGTAHHAHHQISSGAGIAACCAH